MSPPLAQEVDLLVNLGWTLQSQTDTTAALQTRGPFNWWIFAISILLFLGLGGLIYIAFWLLGSRADVFLRVENGSVVYAGDSWLVQRHKLDMAKARRFHQDMQERGFWTAAWPSIVSLLVALVVWFLLIWAFVNLIR